MWEQFLAWFMALGEPYGVNPIVFGSIYLGAVPIFWVAIAWLVTNVKKKRSIIGPILLACSCAVSAYVYLIFVGENVPTWVYLFVFAIIVYAVYGTIKKVNAKKHQIEQELLNQQP